MHHQYAWCIIEEQKQKKQTRTQMPFIILEREEIGWVLPPQQCCFGNQVSGMKRHNPVSSSAPSPLRCLPLLQTKFQAAAETEFERLLYLMAIRDKRAAEWHFRVILTFLHEQHIKKLLYRLSCFHQLFNLSGVIDPKAARDVNHTGPGRLHRYQENRMLMRDKPC